MRSLPAALAVAAVLALGLSGCVPGGAPEPTTTSNWSATPTPTRTPSATPTDTPEPAVTDEPSDGFDSTPVTIDCNALVTPQVVYDYNPNYGNQPDFTPEIGRAHV